MDYKNCKEFKEDEWGECKHKFHPEHDCKDNCFRYPNEKFEEFYNEYINNTENDN